MINTDPRVVRPYRYACGELTPTPTQSAHLDSCGLLRTENNGDRTKVEFKSHLHRPYDTIMVFDRSGHFSVSVSPTAPPGLQANACSLCAIMAIDNNGNNNNDDSFFFFFYYLNQPFSTFLSPNTI